MKKKRRVGGGGGGVEKGTFLLSLFCVGR